MESRKDNKLLENKGNIDIVDRKRINITGVCEVINFNEDEINLSTNLGGLNIKGENLKMNKLDVANGEVSIIGTVNSLTYKNNKNYNKKDSIVARLFK
ncbi:sporulation protein YabP [Hathewaya proteolytica DSM 3090]|uniref:Sporulation protein YabP n=1 Tax=Hathewaya proteolytica DSM 3090 TaxID=1121331 RepID=A0A1M6M9J0_9CLOT|nr:sporulation protein YabP [Hathewaya proteolytica]SHJ80135.1 sporulation protein YabP [Hathewaya proteolytica DSM 3090]